MSTKHNAPFDPPSLIRSGSAQRETSDPVRYAVPIERETASAKHERWHSFSDICLIFAAGGVLGYLLRGLGL